MTAFSEKEGTGDLKLWDSGKDMGMDKDKEMLEKARKLLEAYAKQKTDVDVQSMSREEIESVAGGNLPEVYYWGGKVWTRSMINEFIGMIKEEFGKGAALDLLLELMHEGAPDFKFNDTKIKECFSVYGIGDGFWYQLDREGFTGF